MFTCNMHLEEGSIRLHNDTAVYVISTLTEVKLFSEPIITPRI